jgi:ribonuclease-3
MDRLESRLAYSFQNKALLQRALTHPSFGREKGLKTNNQRLEFLGDAVISLILADLLFRLYPDEREGFLTRTRSMLVKGDQLCALARELELGSFLLLGEGEAQSGGRERPSILEDAFEALIGAIYLDAGLEVTRSVVEAVYGPIDLRLESIATEHNPKGQLQELLQPRVDNGSIEYRLIDVHGPDHDRVFQVEVWIEGVCRGSGQGRSKQAAETIAAREALAQLEEDPPTD